LQRYRATLHAVASGETPALWAGVFGPLQQCIQQYGLSIGLLDDLLDAFLQDCGNPRYDDRAQLLDYCRRSANPIGRLLLQLYGVTNAQAFARSDAICSALQLINFWQDPSIDLPRGRIYFPAQDAMRHGLQLDELRSQKDSQATRALVHELVDWARALMLQGAPLACQLPGRIGWELRLVVQGGLRILERIEGMHYSTLTRRPTLRSPDLPLMLWRALRMRQQAALPIRP
jgi:squalene synthase HpnC